MTDEQRTDSLGRYGSGWARTPTLDRLAAEGVSFRTALTPAPVCGPARTAILTGRPPHETGIWSNDQAEGIAAPGCDGAPGRPAAPLTGRFAAAGYRTASFGKHHHRTLPPGGVRDAGRRPRPPSRRAGARGGRPLALARGRLLRLRQPLGAGRVRRRPLPAAPVPADPRRALPRALVADRRGARRRPRQALASTRRPPVASRSSCGSPSTARTRRSRRPRRGTPASTAPRCRSRGRPSCRAAVRRGCTTARGPPPQRGSRPASWSAPARPTTARSPSSTG